jgi:hypothetical protein
MENSKNKSKAIASTEGKNTSKKEGNTKPKTKHEMSKKEDSTKPKAKTATKKESK